MAARSIWTEIKIYFRNLLGYTGEQCVILKLLHIIFLPLPDSEL